MGFSGCGDLAFPSWFSATFLTIVVERTTQVCKLWFGVRKGMLPAIHLAPNILIIVEINYCGRQLARRLGSAAPAYHEKEGATPIPGVFRHSMQYDGRHDGCFWMKVGTWNLGSLRGKREKVCEELISRMID